MSNKAIINIVYSPQTDAAHKVFETDRGEIWRSANYDPNKINVGMGWYSIRNPKPQDSILVVEPYCVLDRDYDVQFAKKFKYIFTWATQGFIKDSVKEKVVEIIHPTYHSHPNPDLFDTNFVDWDQRKNEIVIVANNKSSQHSSELYSFRLLLADILEARSGMEISWYGQIPIKRKYYKGRIDDKHSRLSQAKFSLCTENSYDPMYTYNYFTEKMPDVWKSGAVPVYIGCHNIDSFGFPKSSYIDLREYANKSGARWHINKDALVDRLRNYSANEYATYRRELKSEIFQSGKFFEYTAYSKVYSKIIDTFYNDLNQ